MHQLRSYCLFKSVWTRYECRLLVFFNGKVLRFWLFFIFGDFFSRPSVPIELCIGPGGLLRNFWSESTICRLNLLEIIAETRFRPSFANSTASKVGVTSKCVYEENCKNRKVLKNGRNHCKTLRETAVVGAIDILCSYLRYLTLITWILSLITVREGHKLASPLEIQIFPIVATALPEAEISLIIGAGDFFWLLKHLEGSKIAFSSVLPA